MGKRSPEFFANWYRTLISYHQYCNVINVIARGIDENRRAKVEAFLGALKRFLSRFLNCNVEIGASFQLALCTFVALDPISRKHRFHINFRDTHLPRIGNVVCLLSECEGLIVSIVVYEFVIV